MGDAYRLRQVLLNLLGNAVKFTRAGRVVAKLSATPAPGGWHLAFAVTDTGIGIAPEVLPQLFQEFTQMDGSITRRFGGSGLGLAISRRLVQAMGGTIAVDSTPGQGSAFSFTIFAADAPAELAGQPEGPGPEALVARHRPTVLLAEDNRVNRLVATRMAERLGCRVAAVADGRAALAAVQEGGYDLVLMDVMMPEMDGLAATRAIRALPGPLSRIPIIGLSANAFRSDEVEAIAAGMDGFVTKPVTLHQLAEAMARTIVEPPPPPPSAIPPVPPALAALAETLGAETAALIAGAFTEEAPGQLARLRALAAQADGPGLAREAHALAGSAGTVGLDALATALRTMERTVRSGAPIDPAALEALAPLVHEGLRALAPRPASSTPSPAEAA
jgi:CheY-like chemotaxis protein